MKKLQKGTNGTLATIVSFGDVLDSPRAKGDPLTSLSTDEKDSSPVQSQPNIKQL